MFMQKNLHICGVESQMKKKNKNKMKNNKSYLM